ncbi:MAG: hypothetical protein C4581_00860 [Nitrospiraceae bacterium]|nr:MAG: hypothetical protein C4581_00860 [Nitrospiraceae bacterium]
MWSRDSNQKDDYGSKGMKRAVIFFILAVSLLLSMQSNACVGRVLNIGITNSVNENLLAEMVSMLINERTGTTVNIKVFDNTLDMYESVRKGELGIVIDNTDHAMNMLSISSSNEREKDYDLLKKELRERMNLIWLKPFGLLREENGNGKYLYAAVITESVLTNFPALPRVINKLGGISDDRDFNKMVKAVKSEGKVKRAVRDLLKKKKLI